MDPSSLASIVPLKRTEGTYFKTAVKDKGNYKQRVNVPCLLCFMKNNFGEKLLILTEFTNIHTSFIFHRPYPDDC